MLYHHDGMRHLKVMFGREKMEVSRPRGGGWLRQKGGRKPATKEDGRNRRFRPGGKIYGTSEPWKRLGAGGGAMVAV